MAEGLLRHLLPADSGWEVSSAGVCAGDGWPTSHHAVTVLQEKDIDISGLTSTALTPDLIERADLLVTLTGGHRRTVLVAVPESKGKVFLLKSFGIAQCAADINDPVGGSLEDYRRIRDEIDAALPDLILYIMEHKGTDT